MNQLAKLAGREVVSREPKEKVKKRMKSKGPKMTPIRRAARGEECTLMIPGACNYRTDSTVLCHRNGAGMGMKAADTDACFGCHGCHAVLDGHVKRPDWLSYDELLARFEIAVERTHIILKRMGLIK